MLVLHAVLLAALLAAEPIHGKVVGVTDGDTLRIFDGETATKVRLAGIDAPETKQPYSAKAKEALSEKVFGKEVEVRPEGKDKYGRTIGVIRLGERNINAELVREGWAWQYRQYDKSKELADAEAEARKAKRGLWADNDPMPPWEWRKQDKKK